MKLPYKAILLLDRVFLKFILVGAVNTLTGTIIMFSLYNFAGYSYWAASAVNYIVTSVLSFFLNKYFTFRAKYWSLRMIIAFILTIACSYLLAYGIAKPVIYHLLNNYNRKLQDNLSMLLGMCLFTLLNYLGQRYVAFRTETK